MKMIRVVVMLLLALPVLLSVFGGGKFIASMLASLFNISVDGMTDSFRSHACIELVGASFASVAFFILARYAADRVDDKVKFTDDALETILNVPRVFLPLVLKGCVEWARENNCELITAKEMQIINDKRAKEKNKK